MDFNYNSIYEALLEMDDNGQIYVRNFSLKTQWYYFIDKRSGS